MKLAGSNGVAFIISYTLVSDVIAKACSSPQTAELNANKRASTLMKWVNIGTVESVLVILIAAHIEPEYRNSFLAGGAMAVGITYGEYIYAKRSGLASGGPPTEDW